MERPYNGIATVTDTLRGVDIVIPANKNWFVVVFLSAWLCGWFVGEFGALSALILGTATKLFAVDAFLIFWLTGWTVGGLFAMRIWYWMVKGKEVISFVPGSVTMHKKGLLFSKAKTYDINEVKKIRVVEEEEMAWGFRRRKFIYDGGTIRFDYGLKTVKFGMDLHAAEAEQILETLKAKQLLTSANF